MYSREERDSPRLVLLLLHLKNCLQLLPCKHLNHTFSTFCLSISRDSSTHVSKTSFRSKSALTKIKRYPSQSLAIVFFKVLTVLLKMWYMCLFNAPLTRDTSLEITVFCFLCGNFFHVLALYFLGNSFVCLEGSFNKQMGHFRKGRDILSRTLFYFYFYLSCDIQPTSNSTAI